jgi:hypothetical protein
LLPTRTSISSARTVLPYREHTGHDTVQLYGS